MVRQAFGEYLWCQQKLMSNQNILKIVGNRIAPPRKRRKNGNVKITVIEVLDEIKI